MRTYAFSVTFFALAIFAPTIFLGAVLAAPNSALADEIWIDGANEPAPIQLNLPNFRPVVEKLGRAVVNISIEGRETAASSRGRRGFGGPNGSPRSPFDFFFQFPDRQGKKTFTSLGSGFVIHPDGFIVTNNHVIENATKIMVTFRDDKKKYRAEVVGADKKTDLALLKLKAKPATSLSSVVFGNSEELQPGDWVIAIGNPFRLGHTATVGIVSAKSRKVPGGGPYADFIQTDASINPGNSGGPLFNAQGEVVGINTAIFSPGRMGGSSGFNIGIGFATPINLAKDVISQLAKRGKVTRGWLGVLIQPVSLDVAEALRLDAPKGALVADVIDESPAKGGGVERGDVIVKFDGIDIEENDDLPLIVARTPIGKTVELEVVRSGKRKVLSINIKELKEEDSDSGEDVAEESKLGLSVQDLTSDLAKTLGLDATEGVIVTEVTPDGAAEKAGLKRGDIVLEVAGKEVNSTKGFRKATKSLPKNKPLLLLVRRNNNTIFLTLKIE